MITPEVAAGALANHTVHGGFPGGDLTRAANAFASSHNLKAADVATWAPTVESDLVGAISKGNDADRIAAMKKELDSAAGSFN
jgi:adenosylcobinamide amidohydrolase